ncbi:aldehyde dehydrogenase family protein [Diplocloster agilis]|uniref:Aldehyde dehydrogenase family protein n=1 Tax=Diplocloster agilis TaxID=2850323 RepID=A0A949JUN7_9FIRM|nr:aldehyde dehydrogenase family protein [Diplocloster agilis]MBU9734984.1 aldehyde dehydrogenase family protein [Diplocloster agilis]MBU9742489.1 aldehyde dehydrogenase family protein [Diplocloster agilis]
MKMTINGEKVDSSDQKTMEVWDPAAHAVIDTVPCASTEDLDRALQAAQMGKEIWGDTPVQKRTEILCRAAELIEKEKKELATLLVRETGKIYPQAEEEIDNAVALFSGYAQKVRHIYDSVLPDAEAKSIIMVKREPVGVVACIVPYNFPIDLYSHKVAPALAAGNAVIVKPASDTPLADIYLTDLLIRAGVPAPAIQVVTGKGSVVGNYLAESPLVNAVSLTGSTQAGISVREASAKNLSRVYLELGGNDAMIIFDDVDPKEAAKEAVNGRILNAGQACCSAKRFLVQKGIKDAFIRELSAILSGIKIGDPFDPDTQMGALINETAAVEVERAVRETVAAGAVCVLGGKRFNRNYFEPTILDQVTREMDIARNQEVFGPVFPVIAFDTAEEAIEIANQSHYGLSGGIMCGDLEKAYYIAGKLDTGGVILNGSGLYRTFDMPFGGHKLSGMGNEGFYNTLDEMFKVKSIVFKNFCKSNDVNS